MRNRQSEGGGRHRLEADALRCLSILEREVSMSSRARALHVLLRLSCSATTTVPVFLAVGPFLPVIVHGSEDSIQAQAQRLRPQTFILLSQAQKYSPAVTVAIQMLTAAVDEGVPLAAGVIARELELHPSKFSRLLQRETELGYTEWTNGLRLQRALWIMVSRDLPLKAIAHANGFGGRSGRNTGAARFSRLWRRTFGLCPSDFRRLACNCGQLDAGAGNVAATGIASLPKRMVASFPGQRTARPQTTGNFDEYEQEEPVAATGHHLRHGSRNVGSPARHERKVNRV